MSADCALIRMQAVQSSALFHLLFRSKMPNDDLTGPFHRRLHLAAGLTQIFFTGYGQWYLQGIVDKTWNSREASAIPIELFPSEAVYVADLSAVAAQPVRKAYTAYGAAAFFDAARQPVGIWLEGEKQMYTAADERWGFAQFLLRTTLRFRSFGVEHLCMCHWNVANAMVVASREQLTCDHPIRRLLKPFCYGSIAINNAAIVRLTAHGGAGNRVSAWDTAEFQGALDAASHRFKFETFAELVERKQLPAGHALPLIQDGQRFWDVTHRFIERYLHASFDQSEPGQDMCDEAPR